MLSRRSLVTAGALAAAAPLINRGRFSLFAGTLATQSTRAIDIVGRSTVLDMLGLVTLDFPRLYGWQKHPQQFDEQDFARLRNSGITVFHPAVGFTEGDIYTSSLRDITRWNLFIASRSDKFVRILSTADLDHVKRSGKVGILIGQQNSAHFRTLDDVDGFYNLGQRVSQLTYAPNRIGGGSSDPHDPGLSEYGAAVVARMNEVGMAVDVSHCADRTTLDAIAASSKPVLITHSNCRALVPNARCKTDEAIRKMAASGGVMGVTMIRSVVRSSGAATIDDMLDHVEHIARLTSIENVGLGTDVDLEGHDTHLPAQNTFIAGIHYSRKVFDVTEGLLRRGYLDRDIELILGGNFRRALGEIWTS